MGNGASPIRLKIELSGSDQAGQAFDATMSSFIAGANTATAAVGRLSTAVANLHRQTASAGGRSGLTALLSGAGGRGPSGGMAALVSNGGAGNAGGMAALVNGARTAGRAGAAAMNPLQNALKSLGMLTNSVGNGFLRLAGTILVLERMGRFIDRVLISPIKSLVSAFVDANEEARKFMYRASGIVGGMPLSRALNTGLVRASATLPMSVSDLRDSGRTLMGLPGLVGQVAYGSPQSSTENIVRMAKLTQRLGVLDPDQGSSGATTALRELAEGGPASTTSLKRRFGITETTLARQIRDQLAQQRGVGSVPLSEAASAIKSDPALALKAIQKYADTFIPPDAAERFNQLVSTKMQKLHDVWDRALSILGDSGIFDAIVNKLGSLSNSLFAYVESDRFLGRARELSGSLSNLLDTMASSAKRFISSTLGVKDFKDAPDAFMKGLNAVVGKLDMWTKQLPAMADQVGDFFRNIAAAIGDIAEVAYGLNHLTTSPTETMRNFADRRSAVDDALKGMGLGDLRTQTGKASIGDIVGGTAKGDKYLGENVRWWDNLTDLGDTVRIPTYKYRDQGAEDLITRIENATGSSAVQGGRFVNKPGVMRLLEQVGELKNLKAARGAVTGAEMFGGGSANTPAVDDLASYRARLSDGLGSPNYAAQLKAAGSLLGRFQDDGGDHSAYRAVVGQAAGIFTGNLSGNDKEPTHLGDVFARMRSSAEVAIKNIDGLSDEVKAKLATSTDGTRTAGLQSVLDILGKRRAAVTSGESAAENELASQMADAARDYGAMLAQTLSELSPAGEAAMVDRIARGETSFADDVAKVLAAVGHRVRDRAAEMGIGAMTLDDRIALNRRGTDARMRALDLGLSQGLVTNGMTPEQIRLASVNRPQDDRQIAQRKIDLLSRDMPTAEKDLNDALAAWRNTPNDEKGIGTLDTATSRYAALVQQLREARHGVDDLALSWDSFNQGVRQSLESGLGQALTGLILQTDDLGESFKNMGRSIVQAFADSQAKLLVQQLVGGYGQTNSQGQTNGNFGGVLGGLLSGIFGGGGATATAAADGGIFRGGLHFVGAFADGGIVRSGRGGSLALVGESQSDEAVVPLRGGKIPVSLSGRGGGGMGGRDGGGNVFVVHSPEEAWQKGFRRNRDQIVNLVSSEANKGQIRRAINSKAR